MDFITNGYFEMKIQDVTDLNNSFFIEWKIIEYWDTAVKWAFLPIFHKILWTLEMMLINKNKIQ